MNINSTELDPYFEYEPKGRNHLKDIAILCGFSLVMVILLLSAICHADKIDQFFESILTSLL